MTHQKLERQTRNRMVGTMLAFLAASLALAKASDAGMAGWPLWLAALVPIGLLQYVFRIHLRFILAQDEYLRLIQFKGVMTGAAAVVLTATVWGYLEAYADAPDLPMFWLNPLYWVAYSLGVLVTTKRETGAFK